MQSPPSPVTSSLLGPNILHNTMFSNTLSFLSSRNVVDQVSNPYKTGKIIVHLCISWLKKNFDNITTHGKSVEQKVH